MICFFTATVVMRTSYALKLIFFFVVAAGIVSGAEEPKEKPKTCEFLRTKILASYFTPSCAWNNYWKKQESLFDWGVPLFDFLSKEICAKSLSSLNDYDRRALRYSVPRAMAPEYYQLGCLVEEISEAFYSTHRTILSETYDVNTLIAFPIEIYANMVSAELNLISAAVLDNADVFLRWVEFEPWSDRIAPAYKMLNAAKSALTACEKTPVGRVLSHIVSSGRLVETIKKHAKNIEMRIKKNPEQYNIPGQTKAKEDLLAGYNHQQGDLQAVDPAMNREVEKRIEALNKRLAITSDKKKPAEFDDRLQKELSLSFPQNATVSLSFSTDDKFESVKEMRILEFQHRNSALWRSKEQELRKALMNHLTKEFTLFFPRLPQAIQLMAMSNEVSVQLLLSAELQCAHHAIQSMAYRYEIKGVPGPLFPFLVEDTEANQPAEAKQLLVNQMVSGIAQARGVTLKWSGASNFGCTLDAGVRRFHKGRETPGLCVNYKGIDLTDDLYRVWPICFGVYPPNTSLFGKDTPARFGEAIEEGRKRLERFDADLPAQLAAIKHRKQEIAHEEAQEANRQQMEIWQQQMQAMQRSQKPAPASHNEASANSELNSSRRKAELALSSEIVSVPSSSGPLSIKRVKGKRKGAGAFAAAPVLLQLNEELEQRQQAIHFHDSHSVEPSFIQRTAMLEDLGTYNRREPRKKVPKKKKPAPARSKKKSIKKQTIRPAPAQGPARIETRKIGSVKLEEAPELFEKRRQLEAKLAELQNRPEAAVWVACYCSTAGAKKGSPLQWTIPMEVPPSVGEQCSAALENPDYPQKLNDGLNVGGLYEYDKNAEVMFSRNGPANAQKYQVQF